MLNKDCNSKTKDELLKEIDELQSKLYESEDALNAIKNGEIDAVVTHRLRMDPKFIHWKVPIIFIDY